MGNSASKAAKNATKIKVQQESILPTARAARPQQQASAADGFGNSESKDENIMADGQDPNFMNKLSELGQVYVPPTIPLRGSDNKMLSILSQRRASELESETPSPFRPSAQALSNLFDERKTATTRQELENIAREYGIDVGLLDELGKHVTSPSVVKLPSKRGELDDNLLAQWVDPPKAVTRG